ncbi:hypothetical protein [Microtetraspora niveoalba]|uniref:hypothetical protein n=1 Tax=Microtetraspora niveoalba TaxID=46175 RepID=UPI000A8AB9D2|nr:hypothetical protein [Microtetraspora niveoalba]
MLRRFVLAAAVVAGLSAPSWAADASTSSSTTATSTACAPGSPCAAALCPPGTVCVPAPKQCFTTPCPQFDCVPVPGVTRTGSDGRPGEWVYASTLSWSWSWSSP